MDSIQLMVPKTGARNRQTVFITLHGTPIVSQDWKQFSDFFFTGTQKLFFIKTEQYRHVLSIKVITETR